MDMACEIQYAQTLNRDMKDTNIFIKNPENIFIDSNWSMKGSIKPGFVPSSKAYFSKITVQEYDVSDMSSETSVRYIPIKYITKGGDYLTFGYFSKKYEGRIVSFYEQGTAAIVLLPAIFLVPTVWRTQDILGVALIGCVCTAFAYSVYVSAQKKVKAQTAGIISGMETVYGIIYAFIYLIRIPIIVITSIWTGEKE